jgi:hypothetical protein
MNVGRGKVRLTSVKENVQSDKELVGKAWNAMFGVRGGWGGVGNRGWVVVMNFLRYWKMLETGMIRQRSAMICGRIANSLMKEWIRGFS